MRDNNATGSRAIPARRINRHFVEKRVDRSAQGGEMFHRAVEVFAREEGR